LRVSREAGSIILALVCSVAIAAIPVFLILAGSDGTEPRGLCEFVTGSNGLLALNPNSGGTVQYSCDLNWTQFASYVLPLSILLYLSRVAHCATDYSAAGISSTLNSSKGCAAFGDTLFRHGAKRQNDGGKGGERYQKPKTHP